MGTQPLQPLFLLNDEPIGQFEADGLRMHEHARVIAEAVLGTQSPFTVGIFGPWGHGKTSLLNASRTLLEMRTPGKPHELQQPHVITVHFNAWRYEREQHPIVALLATIAKAVDDRLADESAIHTDPQTSESVFGPAAKSFLRRAATGCKIAGSAIASLARGTSISAEVPGTGIKAELKVADALDAAKAAASAPTNPAGSIADVWINQSLYFAAFDDLAALHAAAKRDAGNQTRAAPIIAVFIDDLDRCRPENAVAVLEGIKLVLSQPGFVFVLALYREVIERYLEKECEKRFDKDSVHLGHGYIDKIVQLPLLLPSHEERFQKFIRRLVKKNLTPGLLTHSEQRGGPDTTGARSLLHAIYRCTPLLATLSEHSPRKLVRRLNELLTDDRLLPDNAYKVLGCKQAEQRGILFPICLIQRALQEIRLPAQMKLLMENEPLCELLAAYKPELADKVDADGNVAPLLLRAELLARAAAGAGREGAGPPDSPKSAPVTLDPAVANLDPVTAGRWAKHTDCLVLEPRRAVLLNTTAGRGWLTNHAARRMVSRAIATYAPTRTPAPAATAAAAAAAPVMTEELRQEIELIHRAARESLNLKADVPLGPAEIARVRGLSFFGSPITDAGVAWLASKDSPFAALNSLYLSHAPITDQGLAALAAKDSPLTTLTTLNLTATKITDKGLAALAAKDSSLIALTTLDLDRSMITDQGLAALAAKDSPLTALDTLYLSGTQITDQGLAALAAKDSPLTALDTLYLYHTKITDQGLAALAAKDSPLTALTALILGSTNITDQGLAALAAKDSPLTALTTLNLGNTNISDDGLEGLVAKDSPLIALTTLFLHNTKTTNRGITALKRRFPNINAVR